MKKVASFLILPILIFAGLLFSGCDTVKVEETIYLGDVDVQAPINTPPLRTIHRSAEPYGIKSHPNLLSTTIKISVLQLQAVFTKVLSRAILFDHFLERITLTGRFPTWLQVLISSFPFQKIFSSREVFTFQISITKVPLVEPLDWGLEG